MTGWTNVGRTNVGRTNVGRTKLAAPYILHESITWHQIISILIDDGLFSGISDGNLQSSGSSGKISVVETFHIQD